MSLLNSCFNTTNNKYGFLIVFITIVIRIFVVSIAWNYGIFIVALKKNFPNTKYVEIEWIASLAQGLGSLLAPFYLVICRRIGIRTTFLCSLSTCCVSLFISSFVTNIHLLFITYSLLFGIGSCMAMVMGSILTGIYFPSRSRFHVLSTVLISLGFPLGFLILNPFTEYLIEKYDWQYVKLIYSFITLICIMIFCPFFTDKHADTVEIDYEEESLIEQGHRQPLQKLKVFSKTFWYIGLVLLSISVNSVIINLNGFFQSINNISPTDAANLMMVLGASDFVYRLLLSVCGSLLSRHLSIFYIISSIIGAITCFAWSNVQSYGSHAFLSIVFGLCPAVFMSLMYPISTELSGPSRVQKTYTLNVLTGAIGIIIGPIISGLLLDSYDLKFKFVFNMSAICFVLSTCFFTLSKMLIVYISVNMPV